MRGAELCRLRVLEQIPRGALLLLVGEQEELGRDHCVAVPDHAFEKRKELIDRLFELALVRLATRTGHALPKVFDARRKLQMRLPDLVVESQKSEEMLAEQRLGVGLAEDGRNDRGEVAWHRRGRAAPLPKGGPQLSPGAPVLRWDFRGFVEQRLQLRAGEDGVAEAGIVVVGDGRWHVRVGARLGHGKSGLALCAALVVPLKREAQTDRGSLELCLELRHGFRNRVGVLFLLCLKPRNPQLLRRSILLPLEGVEHPFQFGRLCAGVAAVAAVAKSVEPSGQVVDLRLQRSLFLIRVRVGRWYLDLGQYGLHVLEEFLDLRKLPFARGHPLLPHILLNTRKGRARLLEALSALLCDGRYVVLDGLLLALDDSDPSIDQHGLCRRIVIGEVPRKTTVHVKATCCAILVHCHLDRHRVGEMYLVALARVLDVQDEGGPVFLDLYIVRHRAFQHRVLTSPCRDNFDFPLRVVQLDVREEPSRY